MGELPNKMQGVLLTGHGGLDRLEVRSDIPVPRPGPRDVLIRVGAAAVNNTDINTRTAWYSKKDRASRDASWTGEPIRFPLIQGADVCGRIVAVGEKISADRIGKRILIEPCIREANSEVLKRPWYFGSECDGGFAEFTVVSSQHAYEIDSKFSDIELASFPCSYSTAENMLSRSRVEEGDRILVTGASGGVGSAVVQLAKARKAEVIAVTSPSKSNAILNLGARKIVTRDDSVIEMLGRDSIDVVIDLVAGERWPEFLDVLRPGGRYAVAGAIGGPLVELDIRTLYLKDLSFFGCTVLEPQIFSNLIKHIESERICPIVAEKFPLVQIVDAQKAFMSKKHIGKIVLSVNEN